MADKYRRERMSRDEREQAIQRRLDAEAAQEVAEQRAGRKLDESFDSEMEGLLGMPLDDVRALFDHNRSDVDPKLRKAMQEAGKLARANKPQRAAKIVRRNQKDARAAIKKTQKSGCVVVALLMLAAVSSVVGAGVWGAVEVVSALAN